MTGPIRPCDRLKVTDGGNVVGIAGMEGVVVKVRESANHSNQKPVNPVFVDGVVADAYTL